MKPKPKGYRKIVVNNSIYYWACSGYTLNVIDSEKETSFNGHTREEPSIKSNLSSVWNDSYGEYLDIVTPLTVRCFIEDKLRWKSENE